METAKLFWSGRSQAVRLPKAFRLDQDTVRIRRHGATVILEPMPADWAWLDAITGPVDNDFAHATTEKAPAEHRPELDIFEVRYLLDTNAVISLLRKHPTLTSRVRQHVPADFGLPAIVAHELFYGACKSQRRQENLATVDALQIEILDLDKEDARQAGEIRAMLSLAGRAIGPCDVLIAGQAKARNLTLITHNTAGLARVDGLKLEDWETT